MMGVEPNIYLTYREGMSWGTLGRRRGDPSNSVIDGCGRFCYNCEEKLTMRDILHTIL